MSFKLGVPWDIQFAEMIDKNKFFVFVGSNLLLIEKCLRVYGSNLGTFSR
jgi:hypothetical protein